MRKEDTFLPPKNHYLGHKGARVKFADIIGQEPTKERIREVVASNRLAHALMLVGPEGVGKLGMATAIAQYVNCLNPTEDDSCGTCTNCTKIAKGIHPDMHYLLPIISKTEGGKRYLTGDFFQAFRESFFQDPYMPFAEWKRALGGENKQLFISVHEIRELKRQISLKAFEAPYKVVIIWNAETIRTEGANAFLKLLEEPPDKTLIIMTCSDSSQLLTTINSRVQRLRLARIDKSEVENYLKTKHGLDDEAAEEISAIAEGSPANANEFLSETSRKMSSLYIEWLRAAYLGQYDKIQDRIDPISSENKEFQKLFLTVALKKLRDSLLFHLGAKDLALSTKVEREFQEKFSQLMTATKVEAISKLLEESHRHLSGNANSQMVLTAMSLRVHRILRS